MLLLFIAIISTHPTGVRTVKATPCDVIDVRLAIGMSTILQFDEEPSLTFHADDQHFLLKNHENAKRSIAIIPSMKESDVRPLFQNRETAPGGAVLADALDRAYRTNLFVFFKSSTRLMFRLRFVEKSAADYVLKVNQVYAKGCAL